MECKCTRPYKCIVRHLELIDTLWNVNKSKYSEYGGYSYELIDTLWNVNVFFSFLLNQSVIRINRYIMECKYC